MKPIEMVKLLKRNGFEEDGYEKGSHMRMVNRKTGKRTVVSMGSKDLKKGTTNAILKQAGLK